MHLLFQQPPRGGVSPGKAVLGVFHGVVYGEVPILLLLKVRLLEPGHLLLVGELPFPLVHIGPIPLPGHGGSADGLAAHLFKVDDDVRRLLQQYLVVGDIEDSPGKGAHKAGQPFQRLDVQVVGGLIQQQNIASAEQQSRQLDLNPLPAGEGLHGSDFLKEGGGETQPGRGIVDLPWRQREETAGALHKGADGQGFLLFGQLLRQIAHLAGYHPLAVDLRIGFHHSGVVYPFQQSGLAVALLADEGGPFTFVQRKGEVAHQLAIVPPGSYGHVSDLQHICLLFSFQRSKNTKAE